MYEVIYIKADYEPWWMFDDWQNMIQSQKTFESIEDAKKSLDELIQVFNTQFNHKEFRKDCFFAYWSENERIFCQGCDEDLQIFHGIITMVDGVPSSIISINNSNI